MTETPPKHIYKAVEGLLSAIFTPRPRRVIDFVSGDEDEVALFGWSTWGSMMIKHLTIVALGAAALMATPASAATELVTNGGFETVSNNAQNFQVGGSGSGGGTVTGWTISSVGGSDPYAILFHQTIATSGNAVGRYSGSGKEYLHALPANTATKTNNFFGLDGATVAPDNVASVLSQTLTGLVTGYTYTLSFDWATGQLVSRTGATTESLNVQIGNLNTTYGPVSTPSDGATNWNTITTTFQATGTSQVLTFFATGTPSGLPPMVLLDNASVKLAVPEPSTWAMMLVGFGMVGAGLRRRRRTTLAAAV